MPEARLQVDPDDPTPPYEQVRRQILTLVTAGALRPGDRLPSLRQLAGDLGLAVGTVGRAYSELEAAGVLVSRRGAGTRVAATAPAPSLASLSASASASASIAADLARDYLARTRAAGLSDTEALAAVSAITSPVEEQGEPTR